MRLVSKGNKQSFKYLSVWVVIILRILAAVYIFFNPFWGFVWTAFIDYWDAFVFKGRAKMSWAAYHKLDKYLDWVAYFVMLLVGIRYGVFWTLLILLAYRFVGQLLFLKTKKTIYFLIFPNFFEVAFLWFVLLFEINFDFSGTELSHWTWLKIFFVIKELQEIWLHFLWPSYLKKNGYPKWMRSLLGYDKKIAWK